jgi:Glyoxalase-like domain
VSVRFQLVIDCADPDRLARFWAAALGYELAPAPAGFATWNDYYRHLGLPEEDLVDGADRISDPDGRGPDIWFNVVPDAKSIKNRLHLDIRASGEPTDPIETRRKRVDAEASRLAGLGATITGAFTPEDFDHYAVGMKDPEGNEFDIN